MLPDLVPFIRRAFGSCIVGKDGLNVSVACPDPKCESRKKSKKKFSIQSDTGVCHCWVCDLKGRTLLTVLRRFSSQTIVSDYIREFGGDNKHRSDHEKIEVVQEDLKVPEGIKLLAQHVDSRSPDVLASLRYLRSRGITDNDLWYFKFCISSERKYNRRVIFPSFDGSGKLNYYVTRAIDPEIRMKYVNPAVEKRGIIFNEINLDWKSEITITEGSFDLVKCNYNATCLLGSAFSEDFLLFQRIISNKTPVLLALDADMPEKSQYFARMISEYDIPVRVLPLGDFKDVGEMTPDEFESARSSAEQWNRNDLIRTRIRIVMNKSGSNLC